MTVIALSVFHVQVWYDVRSNIFPKGFSVLYAPEVRSLTTSLCCMPLRYGA